MVLAFTCTVVCTAIGSIHYTFVQTLKAIFVDDASSARLIIYNLRLPRILTGGLVGLCLALSGCILQAVMRNNLASPTTIGVTGGASFVAYLSLVVFPSLAAMLPIGAIVGALGTTLLIYGLSYNKGVNPTRMILSGLAISALFNA
ncbi:MAG: iron chelate uptake ABC transporter family permease subunit, partial [Sphaerochaetaceae bacterium]|nr:iron chelate uptake ABC transporter family permease subunit [Sphaerochaetaceae bacterium]